MKNQDPLVAVIKLRAAAAYLSDAYEEIKFWEHFNPQIIEVLQIQTLGTAELIEKRHEQKGSQ